ncbi:IclR family transcriptional regulator [Cytobacillus massiliigabonensis]|uniref:IclR family transcriptional regulator n=1 Tax=Cytobacillus massiliigabonensis TaxID=1871011 RepID=UPI000C85676B|nr:IclR family transcriptional regulator [Cytobacillus massiliigabonensis]
MTVKNIAGDNHLSSVKNALRILRSFSMDEPEKKISELAESLGLNKSTVSRTMSTLASEGFVFKDPDSKKYRLGLSLLSLGGIVNSQMDIYRESHPVLNRLVQEVGETAHIAVLDNHEVIYLQKVECNHPVKVLTHIGKRNPPYSTSSGKTLLAYAKEEIIEAVIERGLQRFTRNTIVDPKKLVTHLKHIREKGFAFSIEEFHEGVNSIAAPVYDYQGKVIAALAIVGPKQRIQPSKMPALSKKVISAANDISSRMGYWK